MVTPPGWFQIDLNPRTSRQSIRRLVAERTRTDKDSAGARRELTRLLEDAVAAAGSQGAVFSALYADIVDRTPIGASVIAAAVVAEGSLTPGGKFDLDRLQELAGEAGRQTTVRDTEIVELPAGRAVRVHKETALTAAGRPAYTDVVQYFLPMPGRFAVLIVTFSTPTLPLAEAFGELFDTMAASIEWVQ